MANNDKRIKERPPGVFRMPAPVAVAIEDDPDFYGFQSAFLKVWFPQAMSIAYNFDKKTGARKDLKWGPVIHLPDIDTTEDYLLSLHKIAARLDLSLKSSGEDSDYRTRLAACRHHINKVEGWLKELIIKDGANKTLSLIRHKCARYALREKARKAVQALHLEVVETVMLRFPGALLPRMYLECGIWPDAHEGTFAAAIVDADMRYNKNTTRGPVVTLTLADASDLRSTAKAYANSKDPDIEAAETASWRALYYQRFTPFNDRLDEFDAQCQAGDAD